MSTDNTVCNLPVNVVFLNNCNDSELQIGYVCQNFSQ